MGRLRPAEIILSLLGATLLAAVLIPDWYRPASGGDPVKGISQIPLTCIAAIAFAGLCLLAAFATVARRTATASLAVEVGLVVLWLPLLAFLLGHDLWPPTIAGSSSEPLFAAWLSAGIVAAAGPVSLIALRDESRGLRPGASAPVTMMDHAAPAQSGE